MNPANEYHEYTGEVTKKYFYFSRNIFLLMKECENLTLGEHLLLWRYLKQEIGYTQFFSKKSHCNNVYYCTARMIFMNLN